jgi:hypothetical protein
MECEELIELIDNNFDDFLKYDRVSPVRHKRPDIAALMLLDEIAGGTHKVIEGADHDIIYLTDIETLCEKGITKEQVIELIRYGIGERDGEYLTMNA